MNLVDRLTLTPPNDDAEHDESQNSRHDTDQGNVVHVSLLFFLAPGDPLQGNRNFAYLPNAGRNCRINVITAGPRMTTISAGKMKNTSGGTIFTLVFALISSARCLLLRRISSEYTRNDCAMLVPNRSVWINIATSALMSSRPVRRASSRKASMRVLPMRISMF